MFQAIVLAVIAGLVGLDQLTKWLTVTYLQDAPVTLIPGIFELTYVENRGAAFGMMQGGRWLFVAFTAVVMLALLWLLLFGKFRTHRLFNISLILVVAGGIGNLIDRVAQGFVVDMIHIFWEAIGFDFPVFNFADCCVVIGSVMLLIFFFFFYDENPSKRRMVVTTDGNDPSNG